ncbi:MAG: anti-sigma factor [Blastocatellia bacterium]|nr:anti-sigma factor [Blastocatellia bacterium]
MNCERCQTELEDFLYGELTERRAGEVRAHLADCAACAAVRAQLDRENEIFAQFYDETALEPGAEMWTAIRARIEAEPVITAVKPERRAPRWFEWLLVPVVLRQAAFAALLIAVSVGLTVLVLKRDEKAPVDVARATPTPQASASPTTDNRQPTTDNQLSTNRQPATDNRQPTTGNRQPATPRRLTEQEMINQQIARAEREYQGAIRLLDRAIAKRRDGLDSNVIRQYESSLALIEDSIAQSRRALRAKPDDATAGQFLLAAYAKKIELMQDIAMR